MVSIFKRFGRKPKLFLGIDVGSSAVKIVQLSEKSGVISLDTYGSLALGPYGKTEIGMAINVSSNIIAESINDLKRETDASATEAGISIPFRSTLISLVKLPLSLKKKLNEVMPYEARKYIPVPISEVSLDWFIVPDRIFSSSETQIDIVGSEKQEEIENVFRVLLVAVHNSELSKYAEIKNKTKMNVNFFEIEAFSVLRSVSPRNFYPVLIVDIGAQISKFYIVENGIILTSYFINHGGQTINKSIMSLTKMPFGEAEKLKRKEGLNATDNKTREATSLVVEEILREANRLVKDFEVEHKKTIGKIIFTGGGAALKGLSQLAEQMLNIEAEIADPFDSIRTPDALKETLREIGPEFSVAIGVALRGIEEGK